MYRFEKAEFSEATLLYIKIFIAQFDAFKISRLKHIDVKIIKWLIQNPVWIDAKFIKSADNINYCQLSHYLRDTIRMAWQLRIEGIRPRLKSCPSFQTVIRLHDALVDKINQKQMAQYNHVEFPIAPLEGSKNILPISNYRELHLEGKSMRHCIASYVNRITASEYFVFRLIKPERATVGLHYVNGKIRVDQIRLKCNELPSDETNDEVFFWLQNQQS